MVDFPGFQQHRKIAGKFAALCCLGILMAACGMTPPLLMESSEGRILDPGQSAFLRFFTSVANTDTGIVLEEGASYSLSISLLSNWIDGPIEETENGTAITETGFANSQMPYSWLSSFRRSEDHNWFELMLFQPRCAEASLRGVSDLEFDESSSSYNFVATCDGKLALFVNDNYVAYGNNLGYANIALSRVN